MATTARRRVRVGTTSIGLFTLWYVIGLVIAISQNYWDIGKWGDDTTTNTIAHVINGLLAPVLGLLLLAFKVGVVQR